MSKFFINRPIVAMVIAILLVIVGAVTMPAFRLPSSPTLPRPKYRSRDLHRRGCADGRTVRRHPDRAADERRGQHELHVLDECDGQGQMRMIVNFDVKTDPNTDLILAQMRDYPGSIPAARRSHQLRRHRQKIDDCAADAARALLARTAPTTRSSWRITPTSI